MCCDHCGERVELSGSWYLGKECVCRECYMRDTEPPVEEAFFGIAVGVAIGIAMWYCLILAMASAAKWMVG